MTGKEALEYVMYQVDKRKDELGLDVMAAAHAEMRRLYDAEEKVREALNSALEEAVMWERPHIVRTRETDAMQAEIQRREIRNAALEEAAKIADSQRPTTWDWDITIISSIAADIRKLKEAT